MSAAAGRPLAGERTVLDASDGRFPEALRVIPHPPERLHVIGDVAALEEGLAIIGARKATPYGLGCARRFAYLAARRGVTVVSGGAYGCDSQAHRSALDAGGRTVVFFGGGCDRPYPARNGSLFQRIVDSGGAVASEYSWGEEPRPWMFRERNRLIAGLTKATLVVEAGLPSGTFSTADEAIAANRDVLVVPGAITSPTSAGANRLLVQGAIPIVDDDCFESALSMLFGAPSAPSGGGPGPAGADARDDPLLAALRANPMRLEEVAASELLPSTERFDRLTQATIRLAELESAGSVVRYPDGRYGPAM